MLRKAVTQMWTISALQLHPMALLFVMAACSELKVGTYKYFLDIEQDNLDPQSVLR